MRSAVDRMFDVIEAVLARPDGVSLHEVARAAQLAKPTAHRLLADLAQRGLVRQSVANGPYFLTFELSLLGFRHLAAIGYLDICQPELDRLARRVGELVRLGWIETGRLRLVGEAQGAKPGLRFDANLGREVVFHTMAMGKLYLATLSTEAALAAVRGQGLLGRAPGAVNTIQTEADLLADIAGVARNGYALAYDEGDVGSAAVAVPILAPPDGAFVGSLAIVVPTARWNRDELRELVPALRETAGRIAASAMLARFCRPGAQLVTETTP